MQNNIEQNIIGLIQEANVRQVQILDLLYDGHLKDVEIDILKRPNYNKRLLVESRLKPIINSLYEYGFLGGIFINGDTDEVVDGWYRTELWKQLGNKTIPAYTLYFQSPSQEREAHLRLNQVHAAFNPLDFGLDFKNINLLEFGFTEADLINTDKSNDPLENIFKKNSEDKKNEFIRVVARLSKPNMVRLQMLKKHFHCKTVGDVISLLLEEAEVKI